MSTKGSGSITDFELTVEIKCVSNLLAIHRAQTITYLRLLGLKHGLVFNFHTRRLVDGIWSVLG